MYGPCSVQAPFSQSCIAFFIIINSGVSHIYRAEETVDHRSMIVYVQGHGPKWTRVCMCRMTFLAHSLQILMLRQVMVRGEPPVSKGEYCEGSATNSWLLHEIFCFNCLPGV